MVVSTEVVARKYLDVVAGTPISVDIPVYEAGDVYVYFGTAANLAVQGVDYTVTLAEDFNTITVTPLQPLIDKIDAVIASDDSETNFIVVRRALDYKTDATPDGVRYTPFTSREFDRTVMRHQQLKEQVERTLRFNEASLGVTDFTPTPNTLLGFDSNGTLSPFNISPVFVADTNVKYKTVGDLKASSEASRGVGAVWEAGYFAYEELAASATSFYIITASGVKLRPIAYPGSTYFPEMVDGGNTTVRDMFQQMPAGSLLQLQSKVYETVAFAWNNNPLVPTGADTGKVIAGVSAPQRYKQTGDFFGARLRLADGQNADMLTFDSGGTNTWAAGGLRNLMIEGNRANNTAGSGVRVEDVKDLEFHNVYTWDFAEHGMNFNGANSQINMTGFIECWNNTLDGIRGAAMGDVQVSAAIRCVNNGRYGFYIAAGSGRFDQIYAYFNGSYGIFVDDAVDRDLFIAYARSEDNDLDGIVVEGRGVHIGHAEVPDNGADTANGLNRTGLRLRGTCKDFVCDVLHASDRVAAVHNQRQILYTETGATGHIGVVDNPAYGQHGIADERGMVLTDNTALAAVTIGKRPAIADTYAALKDAGASITPEPDVYGAYDVSAISESMSVINTSSSKSCEGMELVFKIGSTGSFNVNWGSDYFDYDGSALGAVALTAGQSVHGRFVQQNGTWVAVQPVKVY